MKPTTDARAVMDFHMARPTVSMFSITNLRDYGMGGDHPKAMTFWTHGDPITDVLGLTQGGIVLPVFTTTPDAASVLRGRPIQGIIGQADPVASLHKALGLPDGTLHRREPHFELSLDALKMPDTQGLRLVPLREMDRATLINWRTQYGIDALDLTAQEAGLQAMQAVDDLVTGGTHRIAMHGDTPVAMTGFNSVVGDTVMVGGVYTPADMRGRGYARAAVAMHLAEARKNGTTRAVLSAANVAAATAYTAVGFEQVGEFMIILYDTPEVAHG